MKSSTISADPSVETATAMIAAAEMMPGLQVGPRRATDTPFAVEQAIKEGIHPLVDIF